MRAQKWLCGLLALIMVLALLPNHTSAADSGPTMSAGNHEKWIDRIANLPAYARRFYDWLEDNSNVSGALADPTRATNIDGTYVHRVHTLKGTAEFEYSAGADMDALALDASLAHAGDVPSIAMDYIFDVYGAFDRDHPEVFWLGTESVCGMGIDYQYTSGNGKAEVDYELSIYFYLKSPDFDVRIKGYRDPALIAAGIEKRDQDIQRILSDCPKSESVEAQIHYLNKVLIETNAYNSAVASGNNSAAASAWKCISALAGSSGIEGPVCEGYSRAFKVLCDKLGIPCVLNEGYARSSASNVSEAHMWNYVQLDGSWYAVDVTWNDPVVSSKPDAVISGKEREKWLLLGSDSEISDGFSFIESHPLRNEVNSGGTRYTNGPELASDGYGIKQEPDIPDPTIPEPTVTVPTTPDPTVPDPTVPDPTVPDIKEPDHYLNVEPYRGGETYIAPEKAGFVFAGWYTDAEMTQPLSEDVTTGYAYARFVDAQMLSVKCQITEGTTADSETTDLRLLTGVGGLDYRYVAFQVSWNGMSMKLICDRGYEQLIADDKTISSTAVFGTEAVYFMSYTLSDVPRESFDEEITVTPGWCTLDGTLVTGTTRLVLIRNGY